jgi:hypothetical protein
LYSAVSGTSSPDRRYLGDVIVPIPGIGTNLLATAIQSFEIITRFKGERSLYDLSRQQEAKAMERTCQLLYLLLGRSLTVPSLGLQFVGKLTHSFHFLDVFVMFLSSF